MMSSNTMDFDTEIENLLYDFEPVQFFEPLPHAQTKPKPYVKIIEQPAKKSHRFRYLSEGKWAGSIQGDKYTPSDKTYPTIQVVGYRGKASVVVSCVLEDPPYKQHPHKIVGKEGCENGVCNMLIPEETMTITFSNIGILCVTKKEIKESLKLRKQMEIDPFNAGFSHESQINPKNLKSVRLCFQVYLEKNGRKIPLEPVVSNPIYNKKNLKLVITKLSHCVCPATGSKHDIMMFCEEIESDDIQIRLYKENKNLLVWEGFGLFESKDIHKKYGISFRVPRYMDVEIVEPVEVFIQLRRISDGAFSEGLPFQYLPVPANSVPHRIPLKRVRGNELLHELKEYQVKCPNLPSTSKAKVNENFKHDFFPNIPLLPQLPYSSNNPLETTPESLPSFHHTWKAMNYANGFLNTNSLDTSCQSKIKINGLNLMDLDIGKESNILNQDVLAPNSFTNIDNTDTDGIVNNGLSSERTPEIWEFNWQFNKASIL